MTQAQNRTWGTNSAMNIVNLYHLKLRASKINQFEPQLQVSLIGTKVNFSYSTDFYVAGGPNNRIKVGFFRVQLLAFFKKVKKELQKEGDVTISSINLIDNNNFSSIRVTRRAGQVFLQIGTSDTIDTCPEFMIQPPACEIRVNGEMTTIENEFLETYLENISESIIQAGAGLDVLNHTVFQPQDTRQQEM